MTQNDSPWSGTISGTVRYADSGRPASGLEVRVADADLFFEDPLGTATTDEEGRYAVEYTFGDTLDVFDGRPDVFVEVHDGDCLLASTEDTVVRDASGELAVHVEVPGGPTDGSPRAGQPTTTAGGYLLDTEAYEALEPEDVIDIATGLREGNEEALDRVGELNPHLGELLHGPRTSTTPVVRTLRGIVAEKNWGRETLLELENTLGVAAFGAFNSYTCGNFAIDYKTSGSKAVPATDTDSDITMPGTGTVLGSTNSDGTPDYVERLCFWLDRAYSTYSDPPFSLRKPSNGGTIPVKVDVDPSHTLYPAYDMGGTIHIGYDLGDHFLAWVSVHELMHVFQREYGIASASGSWAKGMTEGGATFAEDSVVDPVNRYLAEAEDFPQSDGPIDGPENSLQNASYELALFLKYIAEQQSPQIGSEPVGVETYRTLLEAFDANGYDTSAFEDAVLGLPWYQRLHSFEYLDPAEKDLMNGETVLGNFWLACYCKDLGTEVPDRRFDFMEDEETIHADDILPASMAAPENWDTLDSVDIDKDVTLSPGETANLASGSARVDAFAARFYRVEPDSAVDTVELEFKTPAGSSLAEPIVQAVLVEPDDSVRDIYRTDSETWTRTVGIERNGTELDHIVVVVAGTETGGQFSLTVADVPDTPDVSVTRWHTEAGTHYEIDPFGWSWTWTSPDVWVDNDGDGTADDRVYFNQNNDLFLRLRNQGTADASGISVEFWYQDASSNLDPTAWKAVADASGTVQKLSGLSLGAGADGEWSVQWAPTPAGNSNHFCVRAVVSVPGDPNSDNKRVLTNFGNVVSTSAFADLTWRRRGIDGVRSDIQVVSRLHGYEISQVDFDRVRRSETDSPGFEQLRVRPRGVEETDSLTGPADDDWQQRLSRSVCETGDRPRALPRTPDLHGYYPTEPAALPPGIDEESDLVTVTQLAEGRVTGGFTWAIRDE